MEERICGILFRMENGSSYLWEGFQLSDEDEEAINKILSKYETDGGSILGSREEIAKAMLGEE